MNMAQYAQCLGKSNAVVLGFFSFPAKNKAGGGRLERSSELYAEKGLILDVCQFAI